MADDWLKGFIDLGGTDSPDASMPDISASDSSSSPALYDMMSQTQDQDPVSRLLSQLGFSGDAGSAGSDGIDMMGDYRSSPLYQDYGVDPSGNAPAQNPSSPLSLGAENFMPGESGGVPNSGGSKSILDELFSGGFTARKGISGLAALYQYMQMQKMLNLQKQQLNMNNQINSRNMIWSQQQHDRDNTPLQVRQYTTGTPQANSSGLWGSSTARSPTGASHPLSSAHGGSIRFAEGGPVRNFVMGGYTGPNISNGFESAQDWNKENGFHEGEFGWADPRYNVSGGFGYWNDYPMQIAEAHPVVQATPAVEVPEQPKVVLPTVPNNAPVIPPLVSGLDPHRVSGAEWAKANAPHYKGGGKIAPLSMQSQFRGLHTNMHQLGLARGGYAIGPGTGQSDEIPANLSNGEYVMDADVVSALGDGSNEAGAKHLDKFRENIRAHKRSVPPNKIPPKAKKAKAYLPKGAL